MENLFQDLRFAVRGLRKNPGFTIIAILVLALGTGADTALFSIFRAVLLRPLPFHDPDGVMLVTEKIPRRGVDRSDLCAAKGIRLMTNIVDDSVWEPRLNTVVLSAFAVVTLALALAGIYGLMIRIVGDRTDEIGIRMAMGARGRSVLILVLWQGFAPVLIGALAGLGLSIGGGRLVATQLYGVTQSDPLTFVASVALIVTAALLAMAQPAFRATRVDPVVALRHE